MASMKYTDFTNEINSIIAEVEKTASEQGMSDEQLMLDNAKDLKGVSEPVDDEGDDQAKTDSATPSKEDERDSAEYLMDPEKKEEVVNKSSQMGDKLLQKLYNDLYKKSCIDMHMEDEGEGESSQAKDLLEEAEELSEDDSDEDDSDAVELFPEEEKEIAEEVKEAMPKADKKKKMEVYKKKHAACLAEKRAGYKFAAQLTKSGMLHKIAFAVAAPELNKAASYMAGQMIAEAEKPLEEQVIKVASYLAGQIVASGEQHFKGNTKNTVTKKASNGKYSKLEAQSILKQASAATTESILQDLVKTDIGKAVSRKLDKVNPF